MSYMDKDIIEAIGAYSRKEEKCMREIHASLEFKTREFATEMVRKAIAEKGLTISDEEFQQCVREALEYIEAHPHRCGIVVNEIQLGNPAAKADDPDLLLGDAEFMMWQQKQEQGGAS